MRLSSDSDHVQRETNWIVEPATVARWLLVFVMLAGVYFFHGFLMPVLGAVIIGFATWPLNLWVRKVSKGNRTGGAIFGVSAAMTFIIAPLTIAGIYLVAELTAWAAWFKEVNLNGAPAPDWLAGIPLVGQQVATEWRRLLAHPGGLGELVQAVSGANIANIYHWVVMIGTSTFSWLLSIVFLLITLLFVYRDGDKLVAQISIVGEAVLPQRWDRVSRIIPLTISATVTGMTLIAIGEGVVLGIAYWIAGVPAALTLGFVTGVLALFPGGAPLSMTAVSLYLLGSGHMTAGVGLFTWGAVELFIVDKTIRPKLVGGPIKLPFLPTFFGLIGGVKTLGFIGLFVGPVLMALLVAIWREWLLTLEEANESEHATG